MRFVVALVVCSIVLAACDGVSSSLSPETPEVLQAKGERLINAVLDFRDKHGRFPASFEEAGVTSPDTAYGPYRYHLWPDGNQYTITVGDYDKHALTVSWSSRTGRWFVDTE